MFKQLNNKSRYHVYNFFQKKTTYLDPKGKEIRVHKMSKFFMGGVVSCCLAFGMILYQPEKEIEWFNLLNKILFMSHHRAKSKIDVDKLDLHQRTKSKIEVDKIDLSIKQESDS